MAGLERRRQAGSMPADLTDQLLSLAGSPWAFVALGLLCLFDALLPPVPSETIVIGLATLGATGIGPNPWLVLVVAAAAAFVGDRCVYQLGRRLPGDRWARRESRLGRSLAWAERSLRERGAPFIISARYVPSGRVAVNLVAGAVRYPARRFTLLAAVAGLLWAAWSVALGVGVGASLPRNPLLATAIGVVAGLLLGVLIERTMRLVSRG